MKRQRLQQAEPGTSFETLVTPHLPALSALAWRYTHNTAMAQDLMQDTLIKAYRFFHRFETGTNLWAWLLTIMRNLYYSQVRKQAREAVAVDIDHVSDVSDRSASQEPGMPAPEDLTAALPHLVNDDVLEALDDLPEDYRTAVLLADLLEYSYKDIAARMHCPIGTVMSRLHRGRQLLQARLQPYAVEQGYIRAESQTLCDHPDADPEALLGQLTGV